MRYREGQIYSTDECSGVRIAFRGELALSDEEVVGKAILLPFSPFNSMVNGKSVFITPPEFTNDDGNRILAIGCKHYDARLFFVRLGLALGYEMPDDADVEPLWAKSGLPGPTIALDLPGIFQTGVTWLMAPANVIRHTEYPGYEFCANRMFELLAFELGYEVTEC